MEYINFNGKIVPTNTALVGADSRALKFGDGLFETMLYRNKDIAQWKRHMDRLFSGLKDLNFIVPKHFSEKILSGQVQSLVEKNGHPTARVRLTCFRSGGGLFDPDNLHPEFCIQTWKLDEDFGAFNSNGLQLSFYTDAKKHCDFLSNIKHNNYLLPVMASFYAKKQLCNDAVISNHHGRVCETSNANIFIIKDSLIKTPALSEGCVAGTMRSLLLELLPQIGFKIAEGTLTKEEMMQADEIFITNALRPIRWVGSIDEHTFANDYTKQIAAILRSAFPRYFI